MHCHFLFEGLNYTLKQLRSQLTKILVRPRLEAENKIYEYDKRSFYSMYSCSLVGAHQDFAQLGSQLLFSD